MNIALHSNLGRALAALWLALCLAVLVFGFVQRDVHDMPIAFTWFLLLLSFPLGAGAVVFLGAALGSSGLQYFPFWSEVPLWLAAVVVGYLQWFVLVPALARKISRRRGNAANQLVNRTRSGRLRLPARAGYRQR